MSRTVIKLGGTLLDDVEVIEQIWRQIARERQQGTDVVVVHGGGGQATALAARLGHAPRILHGRRVTTDLDLDIALWTFRGSLNAELVAAGFRAGVPTAGISGIDGGTLRVHRRPLRMVDGEEVDFGWVGDVDGVEPLLIETLLAGGITPVVAPLGVDADGAIYNVNADTVAVAVASAIGAERLLFVAEAGGLRRNQHDPLTRIPVCDPLVLTAGLAEGWITDGMRVKVETAMEAARKVPTVRIVPPQSLFDDERGTTVRR